MSIKPWLKAFRLRTLPLAFSVIIAGSALCAPIAFNGLIFALTLLTTLFLQILSNLANDYGDFVKGTDDANRIGPERTLQSGAITKKQMFNAIVLFSGLSLASGIALLLEAFDSAQFKTALLFLGLGILCIAAAIKYTVGRGAYGYRALGDLAVLVFFGLTGVLGTFYLQLQIIVMPAILVAIAYGCWSTAVLNLNNMRDVENDVRHNKLTMAYYFGFTGAKIYQLVLILVPYALVFFALHYYYGARPVALVMALAGLPLSIVQAVRIIRVTDRRQFDAMLKVQALSTFFNSLVLFFSCVYLLHE